MLSIQLQNFTDVRATLVDRILQAPQVKTERWQGMNVKDNPAAATYELRNVVFEVPLHGEENLAHWRMDTAANIPWADDHFLERVGGEPLNPGVQWANWPWASSADRHRTNERFNHTYMQRLWPKWAHYATDVALPIVNGTRRQPDRKSWKNPIPGLNWTYGDLEDLIALLVKEPFTRQAYIPLFFPEDTGWGDGGRKPCTLGYQFLVRHEPDGPRLHVWYPLRSCDLVRHFPDDCYLTVRLLIWVLEQCRLRSNEFWSRVLPGTYAMHMTSLHIFENDKRELAKGR